MKRLGDYAEIVGDEVIENIFEEASVLSETHVVHINSTFYGGGVAEILSSLAALMNDVGVMTGWRLMRGSPDFFVVTKKIHNALQGQKLELTKTEKEIYLDTNAVNSQIAHLESYDCVIVHDPQPLPLIDFYSRKLPWMWKPMHLILGLNALPKHQYWLWRCHVDLTQPYKKTWSYLKTFVRRYDGMIVSMEKYARKLKIPQYVIHPSIDPLSPKNRYLSDKTMSSLLSKYNIPEDKPIIAQVSRFDPWKDPAGVIQAFKLVRRKIDCRLVLLGNTAMDDPQGEQVFRKAFLAAEGDPDIHLIASQSDSLVNAVQRKAGVVIQKSLREGFGITVSEALWKGTPVVASNVGGIPLQVKDGVNGFLVNNVQECADRVTWLLKHRKKASKMGLAGRRHVKENFLITRHLMDYLLLLKKVLKIPEPLVKRREIARYTPERIAEKLFERILPRPAAGKRFD